MFFESALILIIKDVSIMPKKCHNLYQYTFFKKKNKTSKLKDKEIKSLSQTLFF